MACFVDPLVSQLFQRLFQLLGSDEVRGFARQLVEGVDSELEELKTKLRMIGNLLNRAEDIQLMDGALKEWLDNLQHWAHDAEDVLDEFPYEALRRKLKVEPQESSSKGLSCLPGYFPGRLFNVNTGSEIKKINNRLEQLRQQRSAELNLQELSGVTSSNAALQRPEETSSVQPENFVYGRDEDIAKLVEIVKNEPTGGRNFRVITIVGMGGIGKTTVAREVYNHKELEGFKFEGKAWARVSFNFDILTISRSLLSLKGSMLSVPSDSNGLQVELQNAVSGKKFLIVLDDVWKVKYNDWEKLTSPFKAGAPGSTIIITTRDEDVAKTIRCSDSIYPLQLLSREACKSLFQEHALATGLAAYTDRITDTIHEKVIERCSGLPLAAKTLGGLLHSKSIDTWEKILDSKIWISSKENDILPVLKLSYLYLPSYLKRCFAYCAIFPEDYEFEEEELVFLWMAEGIIQPFDEQLNETGQYFRDLCSRSLFQKSNNYASKYVMHDLVHNLAESVFSKFSLRSEQAIIKLPENIEMIRHFSYVRWYIEGVFLIPHYMEGEKRFRGLEKLKNLRTFLPVFKRSDHYSNSQNYVSAIVLFDVLPQLKKLRVLSFERYQITHIPNSIGGLIHLRYLNFSYTKIKCLPESVCSLLNLQTLLLKNCSDLMKLPTHLRCLSNLCHLDISGKNLLKEMSFGMKELKNLRMLSNFIVGKELSSSLEDLKSLNYLKGTLHISNLENVNNATQIGELILNNKKDLEVLLLEWGSQFDGSRVQKVETDVLDKLKPHSNLEKLTIRFYGGLEFPSWLNSLSSLSRLTFLELKNCENCTKLPSQSLLSSLKVLIIKGMPKLEKIDMQSPYNSLEFLCFENLQKCQYWDTKVDNEHVERFPKLCQLSIIECPKLTAELLDDYPLLEDLKISDCAKLIVSFLSFPKLTKLQIGECKEVVSTSSSTSQITSIKFEPLPDVAEFENWLRENFNCVEKPFKWTHSLTSLVYLNIESCSFSFLNTIFLPNLIHLRIENCLALKSLPKRLKQMKVQRMGICHCDSPLFIARNMLPSSLKRLKVSDCKKLKHLEGISSTLLEYLSIRDCESLTHLSSRGLLPNTLKHLQVDSCPNLTTLLSRRCCAHKKLECLHIHNCPRLRSIEEAFHNSPCLKKIDLAGLQNNGLFGLQSLTGLQELSIEGGLVLPVEIIPTSLRSLVIKKDVETSKTLIRWGLHKLTSLKRLSISGFEDPELILSENQRMPISLEFLEIFNLGPLRSISDLGMFTSLKELKIGDSNFNSIPDLGSLVSLKIFCIWNCPKIKSIPGFGSHSSLEEFRIISCPKLKSMACLGSLNSLQNLRIQSCPKLKSLPSPPSSLLELEIQKCPLLKKQWRRGKGKYCSKVAHIPLVKIDGKFIFNSKEE